MEAINSFFSNIKDKLTNPFFGTLTIVLLIQHWELWFAVFNFDADCTLTDRLYFIQNYISQNITLGSFLLDLLKAAGVMLFGYLIVVLTRSIVIWIEHTVMPNITEVIVSDKIVEREIHDDVVQERNEIFEQYENERQKVREFSRKIDTQLVQLKSLEKEVSKLNIEIETLNNEIHQNDNELISSKRLVEKLTNENEKVNDEIQKLEDSEANLKIELKSIYKLLDQYQELYEKVNIDYINSINQFPPKIIDVVKELKRNNRWEAFLKVGRFLTRGGGADFELLKEMEEKELVYSKGGKQHILGPVGSIIYKYQDILSDVDNL